MDSPRAAGSRCPAPNVAGTGWRRPVHFCCQSEVHLSAAFLLGAGLPSTVTFIKTGPLGVPWTQLFLADVGELLAESEPRVETKRLLSV